MVIGRGKASQIEREPILAWYFDGFRQVLSQGERRLLVIGYGFRDEHINRVIAESIVGHGLQLHLLSPMPLEEIEETLLHTGLYNEILRGLSGYYPYTFRELFPPDQSTPRIVDQIYECFFERRRHY